MLIPVFLISGFRRDVDEICPLLGCYAALRGNSLPMFQDNVLVRSSRVKKSNEAGNVQTTDTFAISMATMINKHQKPRTNTKHTKFHHEVLLLLVSQPGHKAFTHHITVHHHVSCRPNQEFLTLKLCTTSVLIREHCSNFLSMF
jgi:hypothetical protein